MLRVPDVHLCLIVKNEADNIERALRQRALFASTLVVDTGSTDGTQRIAESLGAKVVSFEWCDDFARARNVWFDHIKDGWILWLDADDELIHQDAGVLLEAAADADDETIGYTVDYEYPNGYITDHIRLFRADRNIRWKGRIHEHLDFRQSGYGRILRSGATILHAGFPMYDPDAMEARAQRNNKLLQKELEDDPKNAIIYQYIAMDHQAHARHKEAVAWFDKCLKYATKEHDFTWLPELYVNKARSLVKIGKHQEAKRCLKDGMKLFPKQMPVFMQRHLDMRTPDGSRAEDIGKRRRELLSSIS